MVSDEPIRVQNARKNLYEIVFTSFVYQCMNYITRKFRYVRVTQRWRRYQRCRDAKMLKMSEMFRDVRDFNMIKGIDVTFKGQCKNEKREEVSFLLFWYLTEALIDKAKTATDRGRVRAYGQKLRLLSWINNFLSSEPSHHFAGRLVKCF